MPNQNDFSEFNKNWLVNNEGQCLELSLPMLDLPEKPYRLYRFLTELEDILENVTDDLTRINLIIPKVRKLLNSSYWLSLEFIPPQPKPGWSVRFLYEDYEFPLTVQMVAWLPGNISPIHNHGTWGIVAIIDGQEKNQFWQRNPTSNNPDQIKLVDEKTLVTGDVIGFLPDAIHSVQPMGEEPTITFNLYGVTDYSQRFEFDNMNHTAKLF